MSDDPKMPTTATIDVEYKNVCAELGQLTLQRLDLGEQTARMDEQITKYRMQARKLAADYAKAKTAEALNGDAAL